MQITGVSFVTLVAGNTTPELVHIIPEVRDAFAQLDYIESLLEFREREAQGEDIFPFDQN